MAKIFDPTRKKYVELTPEEQVRQQFIRYLTSLGYPISNIRTEQQFKLANKVFRADIVIYKSGRPVMIVECKAPEVNINRQTLEQVWRYNYIIGAKFLVLTNGKKIVFCKVKNQGCEFLPKFLTWKELQDYLN